MDPATVRQAKTDVPEVLQWNFLGAQQPNPFTENSGDASGAVYRHR